MSYVIEKQIMSGLPNQALVAVKYVVAHESGNSSNTGPYALENEIAYMNKNKANAFVSHWVGGGGRIVQVAPVNRVQYGCGPKGNPYSYAQVELARTSDKEQFKKDYAAYIWLLRKLAIEAGIPTKLDGSGNGIKSHRWIADNLGGTTHKDPFAYLKSMGISEAQFQQDIKNGLEEGLTVSQYNELKQEIEALKSLLAEKASLQSSREVGAAHKEAWEWAVNEGIIRGDGSKNMNPAGVLTREQMATMLKRYYDKFIATN